MPCLASYHLLLRQTSGLLLWLVCNIVYLLLGGLQLSYGYPTEQTGQWLTRRIHWIMGFVFLAYRSVPFMYELRVLLDWTCTKTTLYLNEVRCANVRRCGVGRLTPVFACASG